MTRAIDTSVAIKWFVAEEGQDKAEQLIGQPLVAPELLLAEIANVAWKKWRKNEIGMEQALAGQRMAMSFVEVVPTSGYAARALEIAIELNHAAYDCFYLALCETQDLVLVTADQKLINRCRDTEFAKLLEPLG